jgi:hypothetical protein
MFAKICGFWMMWEIRQTAFWENCEMPRKETWLTERKSARKLSRAEARLEESRWEEEKYEWRQIARLDRMILRRSPSIEVDISALIEAEFFGT